MLLYPDFYLKPFASQARGQPIPCCVVLIGIVALIAAQSARADDSASTRATALDYMEGRYEGDTARMQQASHPELSKSIVAKGDSGRSQIQTQSALMLLQGAEAGTGRKTPVSTRGADGTILNLFADAAVVRVAASDRVEFLEERNETGLDVKHLVWEAWRAVNEQYYSSSFGGADWAATGDEYLSRKYESVEAGYSAIREMLGRLNSPATRFLNPQQASAFIAEFNGVLGEGIGLIELLSVDTDDKSKRLVIVTPVPDTPAAEVGLRTGDVLEFVDCKNLADMDLAAAMSELRGAAGSTVTLGISRAGKPKTVAIQRMANQPIIPVVSKILNHNGVTVGYLGLRLFNQDSPKLFRDVVREYDKQSVGALILDLRNNPGGFVPSLLQIAGSLMGKKPIAFVETRGGVQKLTAEGEQLTDARIVVLINEGTASAAEVLASSIQHYRRGKLLGATTFGKGLAHGFTQLSDGSAVMPTYGRLITLNGTDILANAVVPDIEISTASPSVIDPRIEAGTDQDTQFVQAVRYITEDN